MSLNMVSAGRCQFCHRTESDVTVIVAGDSGFICDECIRSCAALLEPRDSGKEQRPQYTDRYAYQRLVRHFSGRAHEMQATSRSFPIRQQADLQRALDTLFGEPRVPENFVGINFSSRHEAVSYSKLLEHSRESLEIAPPQFEEINIGRGETVRCLKNGLWLLREEEQPYAVVLSQFDNFGRDQEISLEVVGPPNEAVSRYVRGCSKLSSGAFPGRVAIEGAYFRSSKVMPGQGMLNGFRFTISLPCSAMT